MTAEQWQRVKGLYEQARQTPASERSAFLSQACGAEAQLRQEVESLLEHGEMADVEAFLDTQTSGTASGPLTGTRIAHYIVGERIGVGGMGEVYRGKDTKLGRDVALKVLPPTFVEDRDRRGRFAREARVLASLNHQHIAAIYGLEEGGDVCALVLELVEGPTLADRLQAGAIPMEETLGIARQLAEALEAAHEKAIVHRDLKPANIKITPKGKVKVLDFGLAKALVEEVRDERLSTTALTATRQGMILGTPAYMSPEQATGESESIDERADVWAFGCVVYEMLTGRRPFVGESISDMVAAVLGREPDWEALPPTVPATIDDLLRRCLTKDLKKRMRHIAEARIELDEFASSGMTGVSRTRAMRPRSRRALGVVAGLAAMLAVAAIGFYRYPDIFPEETVEYTEQRLTFKPPGDPILHAGISLDGKSIVFNDNTAIYVRSVDNPADLQTLSAVSPDLPPNYCYRCARPSWSLDGSMILADGEAGEVGAADYKWGIWKILPRPNKVELLISEGAMGSYSPEKVPLRLAYWKDDKFWVRDLNGGGDQELPSLEGTTVLKWSPDGRYVAYLKTDFASGESSIGALRLSDKTHTTLWAHPGLAGMDFAWTRDYLIFTQAAESEVSTYDLWEIKVDLNTAKGTGAPRKLRTWAGVAPGFVSVSEDGNRIVTTKSSYETDVYVAPLERSGQLGQEKRVTEDIRTDLLAGWTPDGEILFISQRDAGYNVYRQGKSAQTAVPLVQGKDARAPQMTPDGQSLLYMAWPDPKLSGPVRIERVSVVPSGGLAETVLDARGSHGGKAFSPGDVQNLEAKSPQRLPDIRCPSKAGAAALCLLAEADSGEVVFTSFDPIRRMRMDVMHRVRTVPSKFFWDLSPDGSRLAYGEFSFKDDGITVFSLKDQRTLIVPGTKRPRLSSLSWSIEGRSLFVTTSLAEGSDLLHVPLEGKAVPLRQRQPGRWISNPRPSPDGLHLAYDVQTIDSNVWLIEPKVKK